MRTIWSFLKQLANTFHYYIGEPRWYVYPFLIFEIIMGIKLSSTDILFPIVLIGLPGLMIVIVIGITIYTDGKLTWNPNGIE